MINLLIGGGDFNYSSFSAIVWDGTPKELQVAIDFKGGSNYVPLSIQDLTYMPSPVTQQTSQLIDSNATAISEEETRAKFAEDANATLISEEVIRATAAEDANATAISDQVMRANAAEDVNATLISEEVTRATAADLEINTLADGKIYLGNVSNVALEVTLTGNVTIDNAGVSTIGASQVVSSMIANANVTTAKLLDTNVTDAKLDKTNIPLSGFAAATVNVALGGKNLTDVADPLASQDAATKNYVDIEVTAINTLADGKIYLGDGTNQAAEVTLSGEAIIANTGIVTLNNSSVIGKVLTGFTSGAGTISATDNLLEAVQKLDGNNATNADLTGMVTSLGNAASLGSFTSANLSGAVTDETGTGSAVFATSPTLVTPALGTPTVLVGTNITGIASGLTAGAATKLAVTKKINGVDFDGSLDITVTAVAETLTGTALNATVVGSSLTSVGTLGDLTVNGTVETVLLKITGGAPAVGKVLTSDEAGLASWAVAAVSVTEVDDEFTATASQTTFTLSQVPSANSKVKMYINGIRISNTAYSWSGTTLTYISSNNGDYDITVSDRIQFDYFY